MKSWNGLLGLTGLTLLIALAPLSAQAQVPGLLPIQGYVTDAEGTPYDAEVAITFTLYDAATGGAELFSERQNIIVDRGVFSAYLGAVEVLDIGIFRGHSELFLGVQVGADAEASPRLQFGAVPWAAYADEAANFGGVAASELPTTIEEWAREACLDTEEELTGLLDDNYANPAWDSITGVPADIADGDDGFTTEDELAGLLDDNYAAAGHTHGWDELTGVPADIADGDQGFTTEEELAALLDDNYLPADYEPSWEDLIEVPEGFADGRDNDTTYDVAAPLALDGTTIGLSTEGCAEDSTWRWDGEAWVCTAETTIEAGEGLTLEDGTMSIGRPIIFSGGCSGHGRGGGWNRYCLDRSDFNTAGDYLSVAGSGVITIRRAGYYRINMWTISQSCSWGHMRFDRNGSHFHHGHENTHNTWSDNFADVIWPFNAGDRLEVYVYNSGCNSYAYYSWNASGAHSRLQVSYVGPR